VVYRVSGKINNMTRKIIPLRRDAQLIIQFVFIHKAAIRNKGIIKYYISYVDFEYSPVSLPFFSLLVVTLVIGSFSRIEFETSPLLAKRRS
jgi:hypothetical protein